MLEAQGYFYEGVRRLSLGLPSPNYAGAAVAMALPAFWGVLAYAEQRWRRGWQLLLSTTEYFVFLMLCLTFSRGALAATVLCLVHHLALRCAVARPVWRTEKWTWMVRPTVYAFLVAMSGLATRTVDAFSGNDASALNRLDYWRAGFVALRHIPIFGISEAQANSYFVNWCGDIDSLGRVGGFVSSYLDWGIRWGPLALGGVILLLILSACYPLSLRPGTSDGWRICACSLSSAVVAFGVAGFFSSLVSSLAFIWGMIAVCGTNLGLWFGLCSKKGWLLAGSTGLAALVIGVALKIPMADRSGIVVDIGKTGAVSLSHDHAPAKTARYDLALVCDGEVMGDAYGTEARRLMKARRERGGMLVLTPDCDIPRRIDAGCIVVFGRQWKSGIPFGNGNTKITLFHPMGNPDASIRRAAIGTIILPVIDEEGSVSEWVDFADKEHIPVLRTGGGHQLLENWTEVFAVQKP